MRGEALLLAVWWAVWSLADAYLLAFTPWSELCVLAACALVVAVPPLATRCAASVRALVPALNGRFKVLLDRM